MISLFEKELKRVEDEIRDLKTSRKRGLGTVRFYEKKLTISAQPATTYQFRMTIADDEPENPVVVPLIHVDGLADGASFTFRNSTAKTATVTVFSGWSISSGANLTVKVICSSFIKELIKL